MHQSTEELPILLEVPGAVLRSMQRGGMTVAHATLAKGTDFGPVLQGLNDDLCHCPHWGYVIRGALKLRFGDGREEVVRAGEVWHADPGHTASCDEDTEFLDVSPTREFMEVIDHVRARIARPAETAQAYVGGADRRVRLATGTPVCTGRSEMMLRRSSPIFQHKVNPLALDRQATVRTVVAASLSPARAACSPFHAPGCSDVVLQRECSPRVRT